MKIRWLALWMLTFLALGALGCGEQVTENPVNAAPSGKVVADATLLPEGYSEVPAPPPAPAGKITAIQSASPANILVFGTYSSKDDLASTLQSLGHTVTNTTSLPADLSPYQTIWHVSAFTPLTGAEQAQLAAFLASGGGLHLTGERPCCESQNASITTFLNSVVTGGGITAGGQGDIYSVNNTYGTPYNVNPSAVGGLASTPNSISALYLAASGGIAGVSGDNVLAVGYQSVPVGAAWDSNDLVGNAGRLTVVMDVNWFSFSYQLSDDTPAIENIQVFLQGGGGGGPPPNQSPDAAAGPDQTISCALSTGVSVTLAGSGSSDSDGSIVSYSWSDGSSVIATGATPTVSLAPGTHTITLTVTDDDGATDTDEVVVTVIEDTTPPTIVLNGANPLTLECPAPYIEPGVVVTDACDLNPTVTISGSVDTNTLGTYTITYTATDANGNTTTVTRTVDVVDTTPPSVSLSVNPASLWPPNHTMHVVATGISASDACGLASFDVTVTSNEPINGTGDGDTEPDWEVVDNGDGTFDVSVRAERAGGGNGRIYTITATATDGGGNTTSVSEEVTVAHDKGKK